MVRRIKLTKMKKKLYFENGKEAKIGDVVSFSKEDNDSILGKITTTITTNITKESIAPLIQMGVLHVEPDNLSIPTEVSYYIEKLSIKLGWKNAKTANILDAIDDVYPVASFSLILREIALELDKKYDDHIENSPTIFSISSIDGTVCKVNKAKIKSYKNFAAFRTIDDAKIACSILGPVLKDMYAKKQ